MSDIIVQPQNTTVEVLPDGNTVVIVGSPNTRDVIVQGAIPGPAGPPGPGVPVGGTTGELLIKQSGTNYDTAWEPVSGDATLAANGALTLANTAVTPGAYTNANVTVDSKGRVTSIASGTNTPAAHASTHVTGGTDKIRDASASQDGLMTTAYASKLDGIEAGADVTDAQNVGSAINGSAAKTTPADADVFSMLDSAASFILKKVSWANIKATLKTYFDTLYPSGSGTSSGTNTGDQNLFGTIAVSGQSDVVADSTSDTLTLVAGSNVTITTNAATDSITIAATGGGGIGGSTGSTDNRVLRADGTGGSTVQSSLLSVDDDGKTIIKLIANTDEALTIQGTDRSGSLGVSNYGAGIRSTYLVEVANGSGVVATSASGTVGHFYLRGDTDAHVAALKDSASAAGTGTNPQTLRIYETNPSSGNYERLTISAASGTNVIKPEAGGTGTASKVDYHLTAAGVRVTSGTGSPEGVVTAPVGTTYHRTDGGTGTTVYIKESGSGNTGWVAIAAGSGTGDMLKSVYDPQNLGFISGDNNIGTTGGYLNMDAGGDSSGIPGGQGGNILTYGGNSDGVSGGGSGGSINTSGVGLVSGGSIDTSDGGGSINTRGTGSVEFGISGTRTTLSGTASVDRAISLPDTGGTLVVGPSTSTDNAIARYDGVTGEIIQDSGVTISDTNDIAGVDSFAFDTAAAFSLTTQGQMAWNADEETVDIQLNGFIMHTGEHLLYHVENNTGVTIAKGTPVMFQGTIGNSGKLRIEPWNGTGPSTYFMGLTAEDLIQGEEGFVVAFGKLRGIQTNGGNYSQTWTAGEIIYAGTTTGSLTDTQPVAPNPHIQVCAVVNAHASNGTLFIRPTLGSNIKDDEGVTITSLTSGQLLIANAAGTVFENKSVSGDATLSNTGALTIANDAVTYAKIQNVSAASRLLGRGSAAGAGDAQEITLGSGLSMSGTTLSATGGGIGGSTGSTDNRILRADGTGGSTLQASAASINDSGQVEALTYTATESGFVYLATLAPEGLYIRNEENNSVSIYVPSTGVTNWVMYLPVSPGSNGQVLSTNGSGVTSWTTPLTATSSDTLTNKTINGSSNTLTVLAGSQLSGQTPLANGGTGANLTDPNADRIMFWDDSAGQVTWLEAGSGLSISGTTITATGAGPTYVELTSDYSTSNNSTLQDITGLSFSMSANTAYLIQAFLIYTTTATATGSDLGASGPASPTRVNLQGFIANTAAAESNAVATAYGTIIANASGSTADRPSRIVGVVRNGANSGTFQLQTKVETGITGTVTIKTGSVLTYQVITP